MYVISADHFTVLFYLLILLDIWIYYKGFANGKDTVWESLFRTLNKSLPFLFVAYSYLVSFDPSFMCQYYVLLVAVLAWSVTLNEKVYTTTNGPSDMSEQQSYIGWKAVADYVAAPLAQTSLFALPVCFLVIRF